MSEADGSQHEPPKPDGQAVSVEASVIQSAQSPAKLLEKLSINWKFKDQSKWVNPFIVGELVKELAEQAEREGWTRTR